MHQNLNKLFNPKSIAVIGASDRENSVGKKVFTNLLEGHFEGKLYAVNPKHTTLFQHVCFSSIDEIKEPIDLAVIVTPAKSVPSILLQCGKNKIHAALILSAGFSEIGKEGALIEEEILAIARQYTIRFVGPNCLGLIFPTIKMNATFNTISARTGNLALVSQSGALCAAILDWAAEEEIGFSSVISLGNASDVDFNEVLTYLAHDSKTESILLYIEGVRHTTGFMEALAYASRKKPIVVIKAGRFQQGSRAALSHTGALLGRDDVFDAVLKRCGAIRVTSIEQLFSAAKILANGFHAFGPHLAIVTNEGGAGVMAADHASEVNIPLSELTSLSIEKLNQLLPAHWSHHNPIDILGDATPERYKKTLEICMSDSQVDGLVCILVPVSMSDPEKVAVEVINIAKSTQKPLISCWMGDYQTKAAKKLFMKNKVACFSEPETAVETFSYLANYFLNQTLLKQAQAPSSENFSFNLTSAKQIIENALKEKRNLLNLVESKKIISCFGIPVLESLFSKNTDEAIKSATLLGFPVVMKIVSFDIMHKQDVGGVKLNLKNENDVYDAFEIMMNTVRKKCPEAKIQGVSLEKMFKQLDDRELYAGIIHDRVFGPAIAFGAGGSLIEIINDIAVEIAPLNRYLAKSLIEKTRVKKILENFRNMPAVNIDLIIDVLLRLSHISKLLPQVQELDINPLIANSSGVCVMDARIILTRGC